MTAYCKTAFRLLWVFALGAHASGEATHYFDDVHRLTAPPKDFYLTVTDVPVGLPADRAGLKAGDWLIGIDGWRVRDLTEMTLLRTSSADRSDLTLTIVRGGKIEDIRIPETLPGGMCGMMLKAQAPALNATLSALNIGLADVFGVAPPSPAGVATNGLVGDVVSAFNLDEERPNIQPFLGLDYFPSRGHEALLTLAGKQDPAVRAWVAQLMKVFAHLQAERYDQAKALLDGDDLKNHEMEPFLDRLLVFYRALLEHRISATEGVPLAQYGVDAKFFALCYPYPVLPQTTNASFAYDPEYQRLFDKAFMGLPSLQAELSAKAQSYGIPRGSEAERYISMVKLAALDRQHQGGWPYRSSTIWNTDSRQRVLAELKTRLKDKPDRRVETALAMIAPSIIENDDAAFRDAYTVIAAAGFREDAFANDIVGMTCDMWKRDGAEYRQIQGEVDAQLPLPAFYAYLRNASPAFDYRLSCGRFRRWQVLVEDPGWFCHAHPQLVTRALENPVRASDVDSLAAAAMAGGKPDEVRHAMRALIGLPASAAQIDALIKLQGKAGAGPVCEGLAEIVAGQRDLGGALGAADMSKKCMQFFASVENANYGRIGEALDGLKNDDPALESKLARDYETAGVPSICLLLARKLKAAGKDDLAERYVAKARGFHYTMTTAFGTAETYLHACRDFASLPGFEKEAEGFRKSLEANPTDAGWVLLAIMDAYRTDFDAMVDHLTRSVARGVSKAQGPFLYRGEVFNSAQFLRQQLLKDMLSQNVLSPIQLDRLRAVPSLNIDALQEAGR